MAMCNGNDIGSLVLNRATTTTATPNSANFSLFKSLSVGALRRKLLSAIACGGDSFPRRRSSTKPTKKSAKAVTLVPENAAATKQGAAGSPAEVDEEAACRVRSEKLCDLLNLAEIHDKCESEVQTKKKLEALERFKLVVREIHDKCESEVQTKKKLEALERFKLVVRDLQSEEGGCCGQRRKIAAVDVRLLAKENAEARATLAMLGAIPPLVGMLDCADLDSRISALYSLLNLGIGNDMNKAAIVKAGALHKMLMLIESQEESINPSISEAVAANFLGLSALDSNKPIIGASGAIPFLVNTLLDSDHRRSSAQAKQDGLRALYNLSIFPSNVSFMLETDLIPFLMNALGDMELSERVLSILSNVVSIPEGRKAITAVKDSFPILVDALNWSDSWCCQEKACYILMVMAHKSYGNRQLMIEAGIVSALLELTLLGSTLAQKRASRILELLRIDKGKQVSENYVGNTGLVVSAPLYGSTSLSMNNEQGWDEEEESMSEEKKAVNQLVKQSLQNNMRRIVKRANLPQDFVPSDHLKSLTSSSTSKSLPF